MSDSKDKNAASPSKPDKKATKKNPLKEFIELLFLIGGAVGLALLIKYALAEPYVIPTSSMEPTLHGRPDGGDRVIATKLNYLWRKPTRWEVIVFTFPYYEAMKIDPQTNPTYKGTSFIKRCVGLPGDTLTIRRGDIFVKKDGEFVRQTKHEAVQRSLWIPVYSENFKGLSFEDFKRYWTPAGQGKWTVTPEGALAVTLNGGAHLAYVPQARGRELNGVPDRYVMRQPVIFTCPECGKTFTKTVWDQKIAGHCPHCGMYATEEHVTTYGRRSELYHQSADYTENDGRSRDPYNWVPDLRVACRFQITPGTTLQTEIGDAPHLWNALITKQDANQFVVEFKDGFKRLKDVKVTSGATPDGWHSMELWVYDGVAQVFLDGKKVLGALPLGLSIAPAYTDPRKSSVKFSLIAEGQTATAMLDDIRIDRDIYYFPPKLYPSHVRPVMDRNATVHIPANAYFAMGDHCTASHDSRNWGFVPAENLSGPALFVFWPLHRMHWVNYPAEQ